MAQTIRLEDHFTYKKLLKYTIPPILMMVFTSFYGVVDGIFLFNFAGKAAFAAVNFILPFLMVFGGIGFMFGSGGSALVAKILGEQDPERANRVFTFLTVVSIVCGILFTIIGEISLRPFASWLGATEQLLDNSLLYGRIYLLGIAASVVQYEFQNLFVTAERPNLGLYNMLASGISNIILDALFIAAFSWGLVGAAVATVASQVIGGVFPIVYFIRKNTSRLHFVKVKAELGAMLKICTNGASELLSNITMSVVGVIYNAQLLRYAGENGLSSYGVLMYINFLFVSMFIGYGLGVSPIVSYHYGAKNYSEIKSLLHKSLVIITLSSVSMFLMSELLAHPVSKLFSGQDMELLNMTKRGFLIFSFCFLFSGVAIFNSAFFTALNNGLISAILSFLRTVVFQIVFVMVLPIFWDVDGVWISCVLAEFLAAVIGLCFVIAKRKKYHY